MVDRYLLLKFGVNALYRFRENDVYGRTDGRMTDAHGSGDGFDRPLPPTGGVGLS